MLNLYLYCTLMQSFGINLIEIPLPPSLEEIDPNTLLHCTNMLDTMINAGHFSVEIAIAIVVVMVGGDLNLQEEVEVEGVGVIDDGAGGVSSRRIVVV